MTSPAEPNQLQRDLMDAWALIDTPEKWGKGSGGLNSPECGLCAMDAVYRATPRYLGLGYEQSLQALLQDVLPYGPWRDSTLPVAAFNDHPSTTHDDIRALFERAIAKAGEA